MGSIILLFPSTCSMLARSACSSKPVKTRAKFMMSLQRGFLHQIGGGSLTSIQTDSPSPLSSRLVCEIDIQTVYTNIHIPTAQLPGFRNIPTHLHTYCEHMVHSYCKQSCTNCDAPVRIGRYRSAIHQNTTAIGIQLPQANAEPGLDGGWPRENAAF